MSRQPIRVNFVDFWPGFSPHENYFTRMLEPFYSIELSDDPDFLIYSVFGQEHRRYSCTRIFYTGECVRPPFDTCDFAFTFDHSDDPRHYRLPLYALYGDPCRITGPKPPVEQLLRSKTLFCCMLVSNPNCKERLRFFHMLSEYKRVDSGGRVLNNIGGPVLPGQTLQFLSRATTYLTNHD